MEDPTPYIIVIIALVIGMSWLMLKLRKKQQALDASAKTMSRLEAENALLEAEHLKFQLQPHTLNNILANLKVIANKLNKGMDALSETLDYILYKGNHHLVSVEDELNFIKKYLALNDLFISEIDSIKVHESQVNRQSVHYSQKCVPHLISAYFIENAFKHGDVNHPEFLTISISLTNTQFEIKVVNRIKQKPSVAKSGGIGLSNMKKRLELLMAGKYQITNQCTEQLYYSTLTINL
jgi:LytS/YehU family sensor histidine kinase